MIKDLPINTNVNVNMEMYVFKVNILNKDVEHDVCKGTSEEVIKQISDFIISTINDKSKGFTKASCYIDDERDVEEERHKESIKYFTKNYDDFMELCNEVNTLINDNEKIKTFFIKLSIWLHKHKEIDDYVKEYVYWHYGKRCQFRIVKVDE